MDPTDHLFRRESGRMVAALTRIFGVHNLALAEDVVQDAFCRALEVWKFRGIPENPSAWLMATAKNRALDVLRKERTARNFAPDLGQLLHSEWTLAPTVADVFEEHSIRDDELRMMFSCCHPGLPEEGQVALVLNICCGFSVNEIAGAFLVSHSAMEKRITRAKKVFAESKKLFELENAQDFSTRLTAVHRALYLLFSEGYHGASAKAAVRTELCDEAIRLCELLCHHRLASVPSTFALTALMYLNAARLPARIDPDGNLTSLFEQDRSLWDRDFISNGQRYLAESATGIELTEYHVEAGIAAIHANAAAPDDTDWSAIVLLYDMLLAIKPSPVIALNRAIAVGQSEGPERGLAELREIADLHRLDAYPFYFAALGEFELRSGDSVSAAVHYEIAMGLARNPVEVQFLSQKLKECGGAHSNSIDQLADDVAVR